MASREPQFLASGISSELAYLSILERLVRLYCTKFIGSHMSRLFAVVTADSEIASAIIVLRHVIG
jgi:hypothetical protein